MKGWVRRRADLRQWKWHSRYLFLDAAHGILYYYGKKNDQAPKRKYVLKPTCNVTDPVNKDKGGDVFWAFKLQFYKPLKPKKTAAAAMHLAEDATTTLANQSLDSHDEALAFRDRDYDRLNAEQQQQQQQQQELLKGTEPALVPIEEAVASYPFSESGAEDDPLQRTHPRKKKPVSAIEFGVSSKQLATSWVIALREAIARTGELQSSAHQSASKKRRRLPRLRRGQSRNASMEPELRAHTPVLATDIATKPSIKEFHPNRYGHHHNDLDPQRHASQAAQAESSPLDRRRDISDMKRRYRDPASDGEGDGGNTRDVANDGPDDSFLISDNDGDDDETSKRTRARGHDGADDIDDEVDDDDDFSSIMTEDTDIGAVPEQLQGILPREVEETPLRSVNVVVDRVEGGLTIYKEVDDLPSVAQQQTLVKVENSKLRRALVALAVVFLGAYFILEYFFDVFSVFVLAAVSSILFVLWRLGLGRSRSTWKPSVYLAGHQVRGSPKEIHRAIMSTANRSLWDGANVSFQVLETQDAHTDYISVVQKPVLTWPFWCRPRDCVLLRYWSRESDGSYVIVMRSAKHKAAPPSKATVRAHIDQWTYLICPLKHEYRDSLDRSYIIQTIQYDPHGTAMQWNFLQDTFPFVRNILCSLVSLAEYVGSRDFVDAVSTGRVGIDETVTSATLPAVPTAAEFSRSLHRANATKHAAHADDGRRQQSPRKLRSRGRSASTRVRATSDSHSRPASSGLRRITSSPPKQGGMRSRTKPVTGLEEEACDQGASEKKAGSDGRASSKEILSRQVDGHESESSSSDLLKESAQSSSQRADGEGDEKPVRLPENVLFPAKALVVAEDGSVEGVPIMECTVPLTYWREPFCGKFNVRGPDYISSKVKVTAAPALFHLIGFDYYSFEDLNDARGIGSKSPKCRFDNFPDDDAVRESQFTFMVCIIIPSSKNLCLVMSFRPMDPHWRQRAPKFTALFERFMSEDNEYRNKRFKLLPDIVKGPLVLRSALRSRPAIAGKKVPIHYFKGENYFEVCIDVSTGGQAKFITALAMPMAQKIVVDLGFTIEGQSPDELPEQVIGAVRFNKMDLSKPVRVLKGGQVL